MRFTVSSGLLNGRLQTLSKVINAKNSLAILGSFLIELKDGFVSIMASDGENVMQTRIEPNECDGEGKFTIASGRLLSAIGEIPEQPIAFDIDMQMLTLKIEYLNGVFDLAIQTADDYPQLMPMAGNASVVTFDSHILEENLSRSLFATAQEELRPVMNGIYFDLREDGLAVVASDGKKLVRNRILSIKSDVPASFILPKKPAMLLKTVLAKTEGDVVVKFQAGSAEISYADGSLSCRLIEGRYPNYNSVIPQDNPYRVTIDRKALIGVLRRVLPFASTSSQLVRIHLEMGTMELSAEDIDFATSAKESLVCEYDGQVMNIGFKGSSLIDMLNNLTSDDVSLLLADPSRAGLIMPTKQADDVEVVMLLMPLLLNEY